MIAPARASTFRHHADNGLADYVFHSRYARYRPDLGRREHFGEAIDRVKTMHRARIHGLLSTRLSVAPGGPADPGDERLLSDLLDGRTLSEVIEQAFGAVAARWVLPSMRSVQFGGEAVRQHPARMFNCAFSPVDRLQFFGEYLYLLLCGTGCGYSVQQVHIERLPPVPVLRTCAPGPPHEIADSIEGWADALQKLIDSRFAGRDVAFDYRHIRPRGSRLETSGGAAAGPAPLRLALEEVARRLGRAAGRRLRAIEIHDLCMVMARAGLAGGSRRAASICLFSAGDRAMTVAKTGDWLRTDPQRAAANNSAVLLRSTAVRRQLRRLLVACRSHGEPGLYFTDNADYGCNPCGEAGLHPVLDQPLPLDELDRLRALGYAGPPPGEVRLSGWQMCNLTTINGGAMATPGRFLVSAIQAAVIGTLQAAYTDIAYLGPVTRYLNERDALLGVSICGLMDRPEILLSPPLLERAARLCRAANRTVAATLGIRPAARVTCIKPEGTASLLLGTAAGIHPHHARRYFRRVLADPGDPLVDRFRTRNPEMVEASGPDGRLTLVFPVEAPPGARVRSECSAVAFLEQVRLVQRHWVRSGEAEPSRSPGLHHSVSHTCTVGPHEWGAVEDYLWRHRADFNGIALFADSASRRYQQTPLQAVTARERPKWNRLACRPVDYACAGAPGPQPPSEPVCAGDCQAP